ncbi:hypothetical protein COV53_04750 [Candidatus Gottesmanbacteria bacterium CG11_big_fil_rev_8_21_14_0_20_37_11]|uniref:Uncharacterized protein n=3 Tax=Candidatus Gottesmaniibacteriota TaxID=1752720 RepID=A0A2M7RSS6_9BACT|nr:MAG: hypothetical protein AUJ73_04610 [Candidatus Gottesmanbacteria bacterium CG1_02_37_22]PIP32429.1 MAG: hypothetical protein COX23_04790 [Candidatus Gottesmanbacteria bacterium CG23_combo_of_CG06-09_8_20_14_all_37_19]PIR08095.1 MAG: hypothetical protein COV53_04750 [Candidatus Gottesmanbacteria bacterium CG11_big_fil_rev_8_21_14_0_20_37_11]PIZ03024.1 MAG: hypothetical protein COY59_01640 [Candidatus Gottesmanbacteria bacterium CG_4_10_14_0_8_um_filter_37_24]
MEVKSKIALPKLSVRGCILFIFKDPLAIFKTTFWPDTPNPLSSRRNTVILTIVSPSEYALIGEANR